MCMVQSYIGRSTGAPVHRGLKCDCHTRADGARGLEVPVLH